MQKEIVIQKVIEKLKAKTYLEIGVEKGINFFSINAPYKIAVDPKFRFGFRHKLKNIRGWLQNHYYEQTSTEFFSSHADQLFAHRRIDVAFIDGLHTFDQSFADFENCLKYLSPKGVIILHDCNPLSREAAERANSPKEMYEKFPQRASNVWNGDVWKTVLRIQTIQGLETFVLDCDHGLGIVRRLEQADAQIQLSVEEIDLLSYSDLERNREVYLNLRNPNYFDTFLASLQGVPTSVSHEYV